MPGWGWRPICSEELAQKPIYGLYQNNAESLFYELTDIVSQPQSNSEYVCLLAAVIVAVYRASVESFRLGQPKCC